MQITQILTDRDFQTWPSWQIIYEWEDELATLLNLEIEKSTLKTGLVHKVCRKVDRKLFKGELSLFASKLNKHSANEYSLYFEMHPVYYRNYSNAKNVIPIIIDFWETENVELFKKYYGGCPLLLVTSLEVIDFLRKSGIQSELIHFPMSLPTIYQLREEEVIHKEYDLILAGRTNPVLFEFLQEYERKHPEFEYLYQEQVNERLFYRSNRNGVVGEFGLRSDYWDLVKKARIAFYSTPGIDGGEQRTTGFNPVTPRFLELLAAGCHILARYPDNVETDFFNMNAICSSINTYKQFENQLEYALNAPAPIERNANYLSNHYTSCRTKILEKIK